MFYATVFLNFILKNGFASLTKKLKDMPSKR